MRAQHPDPMISISIFDNMECEVLVAQKPPFLRRPFGSLASPYATLHPNCSVLCQHPPASRTHRTLLSYTRAAWLEQVRAHAVRLGRHPPPSDRMGSLEKEVGGGLSPGGSSTLYGPLLAEGLQVSIPEELLSQFARADSRAESPVASLLPSRPSALQAFRRCVTPDRLGEEPPRSGGVPLRRTRSEGDRGDQQPPTRRGETREAPGKGDLAPGRRKRSCGRFEADFSHTLSKQLDVVTTQAQQLRGRKGQLKEAPKGRVNVKASSAAAPQVTGAEPLKKGGKRRRGAGSGGGLDNPGQTAVSQCAPGSGRKSESSSSKPTSAHSKSGVAHLHAPPLDPIQVDPADFLATQVVSEAELEELSQLRQEVEGGFEGRGAPRDESAGGAFWLSLPRCGSHRGARCTLPVQLRRLQGVAPLQYLTRYMQVTLGRQQLFGRVFGRHRQGESGHLPAASLGPALSEALGGDLTGHRLPHLLGLVPPIEGGEAYSLEQFTALAAIAERILADDLRPSGVIPECRDLVEQLDFARIQDKIQDLEDLDPALRSLLILIGGLGNQQRSNSGLA